MQQEVEPQPESGSVIHREGGTTARSADVVTRQSRRVSVGRHVALPQPFVEMISTPRWRARSRIDRGYPGEVAEARLGVPAQDGPAGLSRVGGDDQVVCATRGTGSADMGEQAQRAPERVRLPGWP